MSWTKIKHELLAPAQGWRWPVYFTSALYTLSIWSIFLLSGRSVAGFRVFIDLALDIGLAILLFSVSRRVWPFVIVMTFYFAVFYGGSALKIAMLGQPILPEEIHNLTALVLILGPLGWFGIALPLAVFALLFLGNLKFAGRRAKLAASVLLVIPFGVMHAPIPVVRAVDTAIGNASWDQTQNFYERGGTLNFVQESMRLFAFEIAIPTEQEVAAAYARLRQMSEPPESAESATPLGRQRNLHLLLLESFWHPGALTAAGFSADPLDPRFLELWRQTGHSEGLSPAFGGYTANAEYEMLCGFPIAQLAVAFEYDIKRNVPCLPEVLRQAGYRTVASHPNLGNFWNRNDVYRRIGFGTFWSAEHLDGRNAVGRLMSDAELYRQVSAKLAAADDRRPVFDYMVTIDGHWDYAPVAGRPEPIATRSAVADVVHYANTMYYKSRDLMDVITAIRRDDPEALIVAFGDHLPILGNHFGGYVESGLLPKSFGEFTASNYDFSTRTPLIVIDGRNGPLDLGKVPMYEMPRLIARLLGQREPGILDLARPPAGLMLRPLPLVNLVYESGQAPQMCRTAGQSPACARTNAWLNDVALLNRDLFRGDQHLLKLLGMSGSVAQSAP